MKRKLLIISSLMVFWSVDSINAQIGDPAPDFTVTDTKGNTHKLYDYLNNDKKVLLDFFFTTCIPCQYYSPQVNLAYQKYGCNQGDIVFLSIDLNNNDAEVIAYDQQFNIEFPTISGDQGGGNAVCSLYNIPSYPKFYVIDSTKKIVDVIDPPTLQVFDYHFGLLGIPVMNCNVATYDKNEEEGIVAFPNPVKDIISIRFLNEKDSEKDWQYTITDMVGRVNSVGTLRSNSLDLIGFEGGIYLLKLKNELTEYVSKISVK